MPLSVALPTTQGIHPGPSPWYQLVARHLSCLSQPSLTLSPPSFSSTAKASLHRRQAGEKVFSQRRHRSQKSRHKYNSLHLGRKYAQIFVLGHYISVPRSSQFSSSFRSRKTVLFSEQVMSADKYPSIFSRQMEAIAYITHDG